MGNEYYFLVQYRPFLSVHLSEDKKDQSYQQNRLHHEKAPTLFRKLFQFLFLPLLIHVKSEHCTNRKVLEKGNVPILHLFGYDLSL